MVFLLYLDLVDMREWEKPAHPSKLKKKCNYETPYCTGYVSIKVSELRIRDVYPGSRIQSQKDFRIPDPDPRLHQRI
jgi:hypothetical protein